MDRPRGFARRFSVHVSVIFVGPLLLSIAMGLLAALASATAIKTAANETGLRNVSRG